MTVSNYKHILNTIKNKPGKIKKYNKYNVPKERKCGATKNKCQICLRVGGHVGKYGINLCLLSCISLILLLSHQF